MTTRVTVHGEEEPPMNTDEHRWCSGPAHRRASAFIGGSRSLVVVWFACGGVNGYRLWSSVCIRVHRWFRFSGRGVLCLRGREQLPQEGPLALVLGPVRLVSGRWHAGQLGEDPGCGSLGSER